MTPRGAALGRVLAGVLDADLHLHRHIPDEPAHAGEGVREFRFTRFADALAAAWSGYEGHDGYDGYDGHVCLCAAGIVVRAIAPLLVSKQVDPAVVVADQDGRFVVSLLSGHLGGANALARRVAACTGGQAVITTASDTAGLPALDVLLAERGIIPAGHASLTPLMAALVRGERLGVLDPLGCLDVVADCLERLTPDTAAAWSGPVLLVDWRTPGFCGETSQGRAVVAHPPVLALGVGCRRGVPATALESFVREVLARHGLAAQSLLGLASIEAKADEPGILRLAEALGVPAVFYPAADLAGVPVPTPSAVVLARMGVPSVAEAAAVRLADASSLIVPKQIGPGMTCAVALRSSCPNIIHPFPPC
ncbi:cobalt-precorrin 5A hydrolase [Megalodesulfovibrio gigas]|uniref:Putative cobalamin (Vitamin B12) biosynthesis protein CbiG n=1 Tax=Megalodesulfovibrio gigas (strain ATCC 19364 / DSM 1382 / NCIMB 9332 / VKM B-1759) TaxID=1121448 RepID=T2GAU0_MEGG1|nr:cobalamin biosynthesis protein [Megalodesulfovibrio gigas]AGW13241.1 putative cobalamin (vitamin B12) biosynthesis protein CbiG [Megalodesulfovibrio gigas DSM 1382 = ATCC 19364]